MTQTQQITASAMRFGGELRPTQKVYSLDHVKPENRYVSLIPIINQKHKEPRASFTSFTDDDGIFYGIPIKLKDDGTFVFKRLTLDGSHTFNLNNINEAREFEIWKLSPFVEGGMRTSHIPVRFRVHDPEANARQSLLISKIRRYCEDYIDSLKGQDLLDFALIVIGTAALKQSEDVNRDLLEKQIAMSPTKIKSYIDNRRQTEVVAIFERAFAARLIQFDAARGYLTEHGQFLGFDKNAAITLISSKTELLRTMDHESRQRMKIPVNPDQAITNAPGRDDQLRDAIRRSQDPDASMMQMGLHAEKPVDTHQMVDPHPGYAADLDPWNENPAGTDFPMQNVADPELEEPGVAVHSIATSEGPKPKPMGKKK